MEKTNIETTTWKPLTQSIRSSDWIKLEKLLNAISNPKIPEQMRINNVSGSFSIAIGKKLVSTSSYCEDPINPKIESLEYFKFACYFRLFAQAIKLGIIKDIEKFQLVNFVGDAKNFKGFWNKNLWLKTYLENPELSKYLKNIRSYEDYKSQFVALHVDNWDTISKSNKDTFNDWLSKNRNTRYKPSKSIETTILSPEQKKINTKLSSISTLINNILKAQFGVKEMFEEFIDSIPRIERRINEIEQEMKDFAHPKLKEKIKKLRTKLIEAKDFANQEIKKRR